MMDTVLIAKPRGFCAGVAFGGFLFAYTDQPPMRFAANDIVAAQQSQPMLPTAR